MEIYLRFLLLLVCIVVLQPDGNVVASEQTQYNMLKEQIGAMNKKIEEHGKTICDMKADMQKFHSDTSPKVVTSKPKPDHVAVGTTFVRWGRRDCPSTISVPVYIGTVGGSHFTYPGGAADYVCLPPDPQWNTNKHFNGPHWGYMYGVEYEQISDSSLLNQDVPCSVCFSSSYSATIMIPGRSQCYPGWQEAYHGELASGHYNHAAASEHVCLDDQPKGVGSKANQDGKLFYPVRTRCGSLPCPPYTENALLTCVVCLGGKRDVQ